MGAAQRTPQKVLVALLLSITVLISACGGDPKVQQSSDQYKSQLDAAIQHAQQIGVPASSLSPILKKEQTLNSTSAPFSPFNDQPDTDYYRNQATQYHQLLTQTQDLITSTTSQFQTNAQDDMQVFSNALTSRTKQRIGNLQPFTDQYNADQSLMATAKYPKDYAAISRNAQLAIEALGLMGATYTHLTDFKTTIGQMSAAGIDVTAMQTQYQSDMQGFNQAKVSADFRNLDALITAQYQQAVVTSIAALPYVGAAKLSEFKTQIGLLKLYGMDNSAYQKLYNADLVMMNQAKTIPEYLAFSSKINADIATMHDDLVQGASRYLIGELDRQAKAWGNANLYYDKFDGKKYILDSGYTMDGIGYWLNRELGWAYTPQDFQAVLDDDNNEFFNFQMMQADYLDKTPYNQVHATDLQLISHYKLSGQIIVVSMVEQALRFYQNGKLVRTTLVTLGRVERPVLPGYWTVQDRKSPTQFKSMDPPGSPFWYPPTTINYAILYHWGGYFLHDAWWRADFGPGTQFPHYDSGGDESFAGNGSHGCINLPPAQAAWLYANTDWNTNIVVY
jgi:hypothetical protein